MFENILEVFGSCLLKSDTHETKRKIKRIVSVDVSVTCGSTVVQLVKIKTSWHGGGRDSKKGVGIISPEGHSYANIGDGGTTKYHSSVIHNLRVRFRGQLSTTKVPVPLHFHKMIGRWFNKHYRIVNIVIICIVLIIILLMDSHISILGPLLPKVDMILERTLYE